MPSLAAIFSRIIMPTMRLDSALATSALIRYSPVCSCTVGSIGCGPGWLRAGAAPSARTAANSMGKQVANSERSGLVRKFMA